MKKEEIQSVFDKLGIDNSKSQKDEKKEVYENYEFEYQELLYGAPVKKGERIIVETNTKL